MVTWKILTCAVSLYIRILTQTRKDLLTSIARWRLTFACSKPSNAIARFTLSDEFVFFFSNRRGDPRLSPRIKELSSFHYHCAFTEATCRRASFSSFLSLIKKKKKHSLKMHFILYRLVPCEFPSYYYKSNRKKNQNLTNKWYIVAFNSLLLLSTF